MNNKRVCIFVDGENLRHSIEDLFPSFDKKDYLPKAKWTDLFDWITKELVSDGERIRTYWYAVKQIDFSPPNMYSIHDKKNKVALQKIIERNKSKLDDFNKLKTEGEKSDFFEKTANNMLSAQQMMEKRFNGWITIQDIIAADSVAIEFRRAGSIRYDLLTGALGSEKSVDVKLATDLIRLKDIYDVAIIVSGDQDYVPAVEAIKDYGKRVISVSFLKSNGKLLPGGAKRLNECTDSNFEIKYDDFKTFMGL